MIYDLIDSISADDLSSGKYRSVFPELYAVRGFREKNAGHDNQDVLDHIISVYSHLLKLFDNLPLDPMQNRKLDDRLEGKVGNFNRYECLRLMTIFHDVGKKYTYIKNADGSTSCPLHEEFAVVLFNRRVSDLQLTRDDGRAVAKLLSLHGLVFGVLLHYMRGEKKTVLDFYRDIAGGWEVELPLFLMVDISGGDFQKIDRKLYDSYISSLKEMIVHLL